MVLPCADVPHQVGHAGHQLLEVHLVLNNIQNNNSNNDNNFGNIQIFKVRCVYYYFEILPDRTGLWEAAGLILPQGTD